MKSLIVCRFCGRSRAWDAACPCMDSGCAPGSSRLANWFWILAVAVVLAMAGLAVVQG
jgi:hypothetical protein